MGEQLKAPLKPLRLLQHYNIEGHKGTLIGSPLCREALVSQKADSIFSGQGGLSGMYAKMEKQTNKVIILPLVAQEL